MEETAATEAAVEAGAEQAQLEVRGLMEAEAAGMLEEMVEMVAHMAAEEEAGVVAQATVQEASEVRMAVLGEQVKDHMAEMGTAVILEQIP